MSRPNSTPSGFGPDAAGGQQFVDQAARARATLAIHQSQAAPRHIRQAGQAMRIAARHDQALAATHDRHADMLRRVQPQPEPVLQPGRRPFFRHVEAGNLALAAPQRREGLLAAAPEQLETDATPVLHPVGQRQVVAGRQAQAFRRRPHHRGQQRLEAALPGRVRIVQRLARGDVGPHGAAAGGGRPAGLPAAVACRSARRVRPAVHAGAMVFAQVVLITPIVAALSRQIVADAWRDYERATALARRVDAARRLHAAGRHALFAQYGGAGRASAARWPRSARS
jgi:hypothetical protein